MPREERIRVGVLAKRLIDAGRASFLAAAFADRPAPRLLHYTDTGTTLENCLLLAPWRPGGAPMSATPS
jgi:hypothetical protein